MTLVLLSLLACGLHPDSAFGDDVIPHDDQLLINMPIASEAAKSPDDPTDWALYYEETRSVTTSVNGVISTVLGLTWTVVSTQTPTWTDESETTAMWGPYKGKSGLDPVSTGVYVQANEDGTYSWSVFQVPNGGTVEADSVAIVTGQVDEGATRDAASGTLAIDFDAYNALDPAANLVGKFATEYAYDENGASALVTTENYGDENGRKYDAAYDYDETWGGEGEMDLAYLADLNLSGTDEVVTLKSRWLADGQGRGDAQVLGGDLAVDTVTANECWGTDFLTAFWTDSIDLYEDVGTESVCAFATASYADEASFSSAD
jgi:hypothetical protein